EGQLYAGRSQTYPQRQSPFTEKVSLDELGQAVGLDYSAIALNGTQPANTAEGQSYCGGPWSVADCAGPLYSVRLLRDKLGRVASDKSVFGYPVLDDAGNRVAATHSRPWRGFGYDAMSRLAKAWTHPGVGAEVTTGTLSTHFVTAAQVEALGQQATQWQYQREATVGDLKAVVNAATNVARWQATNSGHQQKTVTVDGQTRALQYDAEGRLKSDSGAHKQLRTYEYDVRGPLAAVRSHAGRVIEAYAYDDAGRLVATFGQGAGQQESFAYDGVQMVGGYGQSQQANWEAAWGPGVDRLLEWRDGDGDKDYVPLTDYRGSVVAAWEEAAGRVRETAEYNPEGRLTLRDAEEQVKCEEGGGKAGRVCRAPAGMPFGFQSAWRSEESGLVYMRNRWYSPELGVFISQDPAGYVDSFNPYAFVAFDPINGWDPFGLNNGPQGLAVAGVAPQLPGGPGPFLPPGGPPPPTPGGGGNWQFRAPPELGPRIGPQALPRIMAGGAIQGFRWGLLSLLIPSNLFERNIASPGMCTADGKCMPRREQYLPKVEPQLEPNRSVQEPTGPLAPYLEPPPNQSSASLPGAPIVGPLNAAEGSKPPNLTPEGAGRRGAFDQAKRNSGVPTSQQPDRVLPNVDKRGNPQPGRIYEFDVPQPGGGSRSVQIRDDAAGHDFGPNDPQNRGPHFNDPRGNHYDY
ncbi:MAG: RHS repeat-associated core domain-containing protein, partial [Myxococcaceae bacterium]